MKIKDFHVFFNMPVGNGKMAVMEADVSINLDMVSHFAKGIIPTKLLDKNKQPIQKEGTHLFIGHSMFMIDEKVENVRNLLLQI